MVEGHLLVYVTKVEYIARVVEIIAQETGDLFVKSRSHNTDFGDQSMFYSICIL